MQPKLRVLAMLKRFLESSSEETANAVTVHASRHMKVLMTARCLASPYARAALKLGQNSQRNNVPKMKKKKHNVKKMYINLRHLVSCCQGCDTAPWASQHP